MCWVGRCDVKIAKRDFYVYKIGRVSDKGFNSLYQKFIYIPGVLNEKVKIRPIIHNYNIHKLPEEQYGVIYEGYHSYKDITISNGADAFISYLQMIEDKTSSGKIREFFNSLLKYCEMDTYAMYAIVEALREVLHD